jgi:hypothetical protein
LETSSTQLRECSRSERWRRAIKPAAIDFRLDETTPSAAEAIAGPTSCSADASRTAETQFSRPEKIRLRRREFDDIVFRISENIGSSQLDNEYDIAQDS